MKPVLAIGLLLTLGACSDAPATVRAVENSGMTEARATGYRFWGCDEKDIFHTGFIARNARGQEVTGVVCSGWFKGATVRFD